MQEFLNPKSMLTPGVAGATMMFLVNGLCVPFPEVEPRYAALVLSFVIGTVALGSNKLGYFERGAFWVLNSLVIFAVGFGTAKLGNEAATSSAAPRAALTAPAGERLAIAALVASAHAADSKALTPAKPPSGTGASKAAEAARAARAEAEKLKQELEALRLENERLKQAAQAPAKPPAEQPSFFRKW